MSALCREQGTEVAVDTSDQSLPHSTSHFIPPPTSSSSHPCHSTSGEFYCSRWDRCVPCTSMILRACEQVISRNSRSWMWSS